MKTLRRIFEEYEIFSSKILDRFLSMTCISILNIACSKALATFPSTRLVNKMIEVVSVSSFCCTIAIFTF